MWMFGSRTYVVFTTLQNFDIKTAFLRGKGDGHKLAMQPVPELKELMGLKNDQFSS